MQAVRTIFSFVLTLQQQLLVRLAQQGCKWRHPRFQDLQNHSTSIVCTSRKQGFVTTMSLILTKSSGWAKYTAYPLLGVGFRSLCRQSCDRQFGRSVHCCNEVYKIHSILTPSYTCKVDAGGTFSKSRQWISVFCVLEGKCSWLPPDHLQLTAAAKMARKWMLNWKGLKWTTVMMTNTCKT